MSGNTYLAAELLRRQIEGLFATFPELEEDDQLAADVLEGETDLHSVMGRIVREAREAEAMAEAVKTQIGQLSERKARWERRKDAMRSLAHRVMEAAHQRSLTLPEATISIRAVPPSVKVTDVAAIPDDYTKTVREIDRLALKDALKNGVSVPGAALSNGGETITLRFT